jgi:hypothetical protein
MAQQYIAAREAFERLTQIMSTRVSIPVSNRYNSLYDEADLQRSLIALSIGNRYAESGMRRLAVDASSTRVPSGSWVRDAVARLSEKDVTEKVEGALDSTLVGLKRFDVFTGPVMAGLDKHQIPRHDEKMEPFITRGKRKAGTTKFETYATLQCVEEGKRAQLACVHVEALDDNADVIEELLEHSRLQEVEVSLLLLDREFFSALGIARLGKVGQRYLMPCRLTSGIKAAIMEHAHGRRKRVSRYVLKPSEGESVPFNLVILPRKRCESESDPLKRYIAFATNIPRRFVMWNLRRIPEDYRRRWGIETGYAGVERLRARTTSRNHALRLLYFFYALVLYNAWLLANLIIAKRFSKILTKPIIEIGMVEATFHRLIVQSFAGGG